MARVRTCATCGGAGVLGFERGPATERCSDCRGAGVRFGDELTAARDLFELLSATGAEDATLLDLGPGGAVRALGAALARLEERVEALERELARR